MNADRILALKLVGDVSSINKSLKQSQGRLRSFGASAGSWMKAAGIGLAIEGVSKLGDALGDAWAGFREGEKASAQLGTTWGNLNVKGADLQGTIDKIGAMTLKLGTDDVEAINAFNTALQMTGGKPAQAMDRLRIAQDLVANGSAPNLASAMKLIDRAGSGSAATVRKFGLTSDTAAGRIKELGEKVKGAAKHARDLDPLGAASNAIGEGLETIVGALSKGDLDGAAEGITAIGVALSTFGSDIAPGVTTALDALTDGGWSKFSDWVGTTFTPVIDDLGEAVRAMGLLWGEVQPALDAALTAATPLIEAMSTSVAGGLGFILDAITGTIRTLSALLKGDFAGALGTITSTLATLGTDLDAFLFGIPGQIGSIAGDVLKQAQKVGDNLYDGMASAVADLAKFIAQTWNSIGSFPAGGFTFAEAFDVEIMGQHVGWPKIAIGWGAGDIIPNISVPGLAKGGITTGPTLAMIGEAPGRPHEAIIPLDRMGDLGGGSTYNIVVNVAPGGDLAETGRRIVAAIRAYERGDGKVWRTA